MYFFESGVYSCILFREKYLVSSKAQNLCCMLKLLLSSNNFNNDFFLTKKTSTSPHLLAPKKVHVKLFKVS